jgi:hypothetical protein
LVIRIYINGKTLLKLLKKETLKLFVYPKLPDLQNSTSLPEVPRLGPFVLLVRATCTRR